VLVAVSLQIAVGHAPIVGQRVAVLDLEQLHAQRAAFDHRHPGACLRNLEAVLDFKAKHVVIPANRRLQVRDADASVMKFELDRHCIPCQ
jgi:hypothetical protein